MPEFRKSTRVELGCRGFRHHGADQKAWNCRGAGDGECAFVKKEAAVHRHGRFLEIGLRAVSLSALKVRRAEQQPGQQLVFSFRAPMDSARGSAAPASPIRFPARTARQIPVEPRREWSRLRRRQSVRFQSRFFALRRRHASGAELARSGSGVQLMVMPGNRLPANVSAKFMRSTSALVLTHVGRLPVPARRRNRAVDGHPHLVEVVDQRLSLHVGVAGARGRDHKFQRRLHLCAICGCGPELRRTEQTLQNRRGVPWLERNTLAMRSTRACGGSSEQSGWPACG